MRAVPIRMRILICIAIIVRIRNAETGIRNAETRIRNAETRMRNDETRIMNAKTRVRIGTSIGHLACIGNAETRRGKISVDFLRGPKTEKGRGRGGVRVRVRGETPAALPSPPHPLTSSALRPLPVLRPLKNSHETFPIRVSLLIRVSILIRVSAYPKQVQFLIRVSAFLIRVSILMRIRIHIGIRPVPLRKGLALIGIGTVLIRIRSPYRIRNPYSNKDLYTYWNS